MNSTPYVPEKVKSQRKPYAKKPYSCYNILMDILVVGNVLKDVYLNLDDRTEHFERDKNNTNWLDLAFNASEHHFFSRESSLGGAAVTLEVLSKLGLQALISDSDLKYEPDGLTYSQPAETYRYILVSNGQPCYFTPTTHKATTFATPGDAYDYLYIDRSAKIDHPTAQKIISYLEISRNTKLILYLKDQDDQILNQLIPYANLVFCEVNRGKSAKHQAPELAELSPKSTVFIAENQLSYLNLSEPIKIERVDIFTHLSVYSIAAATILGSFILGKTVEESLRLARANLENSSQNSTLSLAELQEISESLNNGDDLELIAANLVLPPKGILAADESGGSIHKKFDQLNIPDTYENRRDYRNMLFTAPDLEQYVNGVILFDETARQQADSGQSFVDFLTSKRIIPGIKVDQGLKPYQDSTETYTAGLDNLANRLKEYYLMGLRFAKWRAAFEVHLDNQGNFLTPTDSCIVENCKILAEYAATCQSAGLVPIVEPEVVYDGYYDIQQSATITGKILDQLFTELANSKVNLRACILKTSMVLAGKQFPTQSTPAEVGQATAAVLKEHVPAELAGVVFLSGGQTPEQATDNLLAIQANGPFPWPVTFSFARALQDPALYAWAGNNTNTEKAHQAFLDRLIANTKNAKNTKIS